MPDPEGTAVAVIFARGTGDAVPFLSARLLAGRPLLHYTIDAVRKAAKIEHLYVSTEDERIADVARAHGVEVLLRPDDLSQHETPMGAAVDHAAHELRRRHPETAHIVGVPGDAVFLDPAAVDETVEKIRSSDCDRVIAVVPEFKKYVIWRTSKKKGLDLIVPPPHMRDKSQRHYSEPGVVTAWRIGEGGSIPMDSGDIAYVEIDERSAFRVDTEHDIFLAERLLGPKRLALRCDGSPQMGMGHVMRLLNVASHLRKEGGEWLVRVFVGSDHLEGAKILAERGIDVEVVRSRDTAHWLARIEAFSPQIVFTDLPFVPAHYSEGLCDLPAETITLVDSVADLDPKTARLDTVICLLDEELPYPCRAYHRGPSFAALHESVTERIGGAKSERRFTAGPLNLTLAFGTGDPLRLTAKTMKALLEEPELLQGLTIILKSEHQDEDFSRMIERFPFKPKVVTSPSDRLGELLEACDTAVVSGGITAYESSALGVPTIVLCQNERESSRMEHFERSGSIVLLGAGEKVTPAQFLRTLRRLSGDPGLRRKLSESGLKLSDGRGLERIAGVVGSLAEKTAK